MNYLQVEKLSKSWGELELFEDITFNINQGEKLALIAKNGTGKTSLLDILSGKDIADSGTIEFAKDIEVAYLEQSPDFEDGNTVIEAIFQSSSLQVQTIKEYNTAINQDDQKRLDKAIEEMNRLHAWDYETRIKQILSRLNIINFNQPIHQLSGGEKKRVALAHTLINEPDFIILDEPTNHLDLDMIEWLEEYLKKAKSTLLMVTHDRYFLDRVCDVILELDNKTLFRYKGNYSYFVEKRAERIQNLKANVEKARNLYRKELDWMRRMPQARATKAKARIDAFYDLEDKAHQNLQENSLDINVKAARMGKKIVEMYNVHKRFDEIVILEDFSYLFKRNEKLGIVGKNGTGKTTFLNILTGETQADAGKIEKGESLRFAYYTQSGMQLKDDKRVIEVIKDIAEVIHLDGGSKMSASQFLRHWMFNDDMHYNYVSKLSGGEKRRLHLMTVLMKNPNFLILDEPTNDLDIMTINVLEEYLKSFQGCVIVVSHDRFFMDKVVEHLFVFEGEGKIRDFAGNYTQYREVVNKEQRQIQKEKPKKQKVERKEKPKQKKRSYKEQKEFESLEQEIEKLEREKQDLEKQISSGELAQKDLFEKSNKTGELMQLIDDKTMRWIDLSEKE